MLKCFWISFRLRMAYRINSILYALRQIPLVKKVIPVTLYGNTILKNIITCIALLWELLSIFINKGLYVLVFVFVPVFFISNDTKILMILNILFFLTIAGAISNNTMFDPTKDKYYAMILMRMDARKYTLTNYLYNMFKILLGMGISLICLRFFFNTPLYICILIPVYIVFSKMISAAFSLYRFDKKGQIRNENSPVFTVWTGIIICWILAYAGLFLRMYLPFYVYIGSMLIVCIVGLILSRYVWNYGKYKEMYRILLQNTPLDMQAIMKDAQAKNITDAIKMDETITSDKTGYAYFNDLFVKRHKKILWRYSKKLSLIIIGVALVIGIGELFFDEVGMIVQKFVLDYLPYFIFILYSFNSSKSVVQAMFRNCDHSMLTYSFYRRPEVILSLFRLRLRSLILINLFPAVALAIGLDVLLALSGSKESLLVYLIVFICIISTSIFFSIHYLTCYYLLQPYNEFTETKSATYSLIMSLTYGICFAFIYLHMSTYVFGTIMTLFSLVYFVISYRLVYKKASQTFRLRR